MGLPDTVNGREEGGVGGGGGGGGRAHVEEWEREGQGEKGREKQRERESDEQDIHKDKLTREIEVLKGHLLMFC